MERQDKIVMVGAITVALVMLYMIKPAQINAFCSDWNDKLFDKYTDIENAPPSDKAVMDWINAERESLIYDTACSDITMFF